MRRRRTKCRYSRFSDIDVTALLGNHVQQRNAPVPVGLPDHIQISRGLVANSRGDKESLVPVTLDIEQDSV